MFASALHVTFFFVLLLLQGVACAPLIAPSAISHLPRGDLPPPETNNVTLDGKEYTAIALGWMDQGYFSRSFKIKDGFQVGDNQNRVPAILKQMRTRSENEESQTRAEISFLKRPTIALHLFSQWSEKNTKGTYQMDVVVRDIGEDDPPFKPFYKLYLEDETMDAIEGLSVARKNIESRLIWYANKENLLYGDHSIRNIFLRKEATTRERVNRDRSIESDDDVRVMPIDWGQQDNFASVVDVSEKMNKEEWLQSYIKNLEPRLQESFNVEELYHELKRRSARLRKRDFSEIKYNDVCYPLLHIKTTHGNVYKIVGGFKQESALLMVRDVNFSSDRDILYLQRTGLFLGKKEVDLGDHREVSIFLKDTRKTAQNTELDKEETFLC